MTKRLVVSVGVFIAVGVIFIFAIRPGVLLQPTAAVPPTAPIATSAVEMAATPLVPHQNSIASATVGISDWKTYRNERFGFEFLYPARAIVEQQTTGGTVGLRSQDDFLTELLVYEPRRNVSQGGFWQLINIYKKSNQESLKAWFNRNIDFQGELIETTLNGYASLDVRGGGSDGLGVLNGFFVQHEQVVVELDRSDSFLSDEASPDQQRLIGSLLFTD
jgi:hypothetical protein